MQPRQQFGLNWRRACTSKTTLSRVFPSGIQKTVTTEDAKDLGSDVRIVAHDPDPKAGDQQTDLIRTVYGEPDPSIFVPPAEYSIQAANNKRRASLEEQISSPHFPLLVTTAKSSIDVTRRGC